MCGGRGPLVLMFFPTSLCGVLVFGWALPRFLLPPPPPPPACSRTTCPHTTCAHTTYSHTTCPQLAHTHNLSTHTTYSHTQKLPHTQLAHTQLAHTHTQLVHTRLTHTQLAHTQLPHTQLTHTQLTHTQLVHTRLAHTQPVHTRLVHTRLTHTHNLSVAGAALGDIDLHFAWQAWRLATWTFTLRGRHGTRRHQPPLCVAGVVLMALGWLWWCAWAPWSLRLFAWHAWHLATSTFILRGKRGTWRHRPSLCVAGVALGDIAAAVCVAGMALGDIDLHFAWQAWHLATWTCTLRGRRGTYGTGLALAARLVPS